MVMHMVMQLAGNVRRAAEQREHAHGPRVSWSAPDRLDQGTDVSGLISTGYLHKIPITFCYSSDGFSGFSGFSSFSGFSGFRFAGASPLNPMIKQQIPTCPVDVPGSLGLQPGCLASGECPHWRPHVPTTSTTHQTGIQESSPARPSMRPPAIRQALRGRHTLFVSVPRSLTKGSSRYDSRCPSTCVAPAATIRSARASGSTPRRRQLASTSLQR